MKARELMQELFALASEPVEDTVDTCKAGDPEREVRKVATCFIATPDVIRKAHAWGADLLITHEPTYYDHRDNCDCLPNDPVIAAKKALIEDTEITIYRYHDHMHAMQVDAIVLGVIQKLGWECTDSGEFGIALHLRYPMTARQMAADIEKKLGVRHVGMAGTLDVLMDKVMPLIGSPGEDWHARALASPECEVLLGGEVGQWRIAEYARDAAQLGIHKSVLAIGHVGSERAGMERLADEIGKTHTDVEALYIECDEVYKYLQ